MSGFAYKLKSSTAIVPVAYAVMPEESAGKIGKWIGVIAAVIIPFAAPAIFGAIASSGFLGGAIASAAASGGLVGIATNVIGSAAIGGLLNAGAALASGANVGQAFAQGALSGGLGGLGRGLGVGQAAGATTNAAGVAKSGAALLPSAGTIGTGAVGGVSGGTAGLTAATAGATGAGMAAGSAASNVLSPSLQQGIGRMFSGTGAIDMNRIGAAIINAAVNGETVAGAEALVEQQRAELAQLAASDRAVYEQRIRVAQDILNEASQMDPEWVGRIRMADVAGVEANQFRQAMRNIATRQGGSLDSGQRKAYERGAALHTARSKALAFGRGFTEAQGARAQMKGSAAGLLGPDQASFTNIQASGEWGAAGLRAAADGRNNTAAGFTNALTSGNYDPAADPRPQEDEDNQTQSPYGIFTGPGFGGPRG